MMMRNHLRHFSLSFAALALVVAPIGCSPDAPPSSVVEINPTPARSSMPILDKLEREVDHDVRQAAGEVQREADHVKRSVEADKHKIKATEEDLKKSTEKTIDNVLGDPR